MAALVVLSGTVGLLMSAWGGWRAAGCPRDTLPDTLVVGVIIELLTLLLCAAWLITGGP